MFDPELTLSVQPVAAPSWYQLGVPVIDGSGSMTLLYQGDPETGAPVGVTKAQATESALRSFIGRLQKSGNAVNFGLSFVSFNDKVTDRRPPKHVLELDVADSYDPTAHGTGGTAIHCGLDAATSIIDDFMKEGAASEVPLSAIAVVMSDGEERDDPVKTAEAAERLRSLPNTKLAACLFATHGQPAHGESLLREIVSEPDLYQRIYDTEGLRSFFQRTMTVHHGPESVE
jgi:hypothetical protein